MLPVTGGILVPHRPIPKQDRVPRDRLALFPAWIEDWNPRRIFCAYDASPGGDDAAQRLFRRDSRVVRVRPALDGDDWNDMRRRDLEGNKLEIDDRLID